MMSMPERASLSLFPVCPGCTAGLSEGRGEYRAVREIFAGSTLNECGNCGLVYVWPLPAAQELEEYNSRYFTSAHGGIPSSRVAIAYHRGLASLRAAHIRDAMEHFGIEIKRVLEIGPGTGILRDLLESQYGSFDYVAVESDESCQQILRSRGARVYPRTVEVLLNEAPSDLVIMSHVLEHTAEPLTFLREVLSMLRPGGLVFIEVPCRDDMYKDVLEPHLLFFDKQSMAVLLKNVGLTDLLLTYHGRSIDAVRSERTLHRRIINIVRSHLIKWGMARLLVASDGRLRAIPDSLARAAVAPSEVHRTKDQPSAWLRAAARKPD
jgi:SAM-dependent methyltransferase